ncbi:SURF1 family protein [Croceibacterium aestuarii]|uniref:SURF1 family protein n=1 Tax=Croceibacterium aestuarii TaxID=3064139 RepID=UPI00272E9A5A|nr:SURF1 family protein [Croceibacterium sp. D39]
MRRLPIVPTVVVVLAAATMIALGVWQLQRLQWKEGLLARYHDAQAMSAQVPWPSDPADYAGALYRRSSVDCASVRGFDAISGRSQDQRSGWAHIAHCTLAGGGSAEVALGWSTDSAAPQWSGGEVAGVIGPSKGGIKLVASPPQGGLQQLAVPDPSEIPNNHLAYAVQWFLFALTALVIYALALRKKWRAEGRDAR